MILLTNVCAEKRRISARLGEAPSSGITQLREIKSPPKRGLSGAPQGQKLTLIYRLTSTWFTTWRTFGTFLASSAASSRCPGFLTLPVSTNTPFLAL